MADEPRTCKFCGTQDGTVKERRMSCQYNDDAQNYLTSCLECYEETEEMWNDMFEEYYASISTM